MAGRSKGPYPPGLETAIFGMGCFWGAERKFWQLGEGIHVTAVGYAGGATPNPTYEEVCSGMTGHTEVVLVVYDPNKISYDRLLATFWESHDPTQGMRQGNDTGTQYRSAIYATSPSPACRCGSVQGRLWQGARRPRLSADHHGNPRRPRSFISPKPITSNISPRIRGGYCGLGGTGVACAIGTESRRSAPN